MIKQIVKMIVARQQLTGDICIIIRSSYGRLKNVLGSQKRTPRKNCQTEDKSSDAGLELQDLHQEWSVLGGDEPQGAGGLLQLQWRRTKGSSLSGSRIFDKIELHTDRVA